MYVVKRLVWMSNGKVGPLLAEGRPVQTGTESWRKSKKEIEQNIKTSNLYANIFVDIQF